MKNTESFQRQAYNNEREKNIVTLCHYVAVEEEVERGIKAIIISTHNIYTSSETKVYLLAA